ncbi:MAG: prolyl oligopeptidase family serine peptidase, partial [Oscillospiraceae bacterium]|nr:prolyl oligopeptidase family serine peptidase [Oscillospiraceae bacterium]
GTCEIVSTLYDTGSANYTDLVQRIRQKTNAIVYAPQLLLWFDSYNTDDCEKSDNIGHNDRLRQVGGSVAALEITKVMRTVDWICANLPVDTDRMGIAGLSYGGFYTLMTAAVDTRYRAALSSCFFSDRLKHAWGDWVWFDSASKFLDPEIASLVCPRALCIESGAADPLFAIDDTVRTVGAVAERYAALGIADRFRFHIHPGDHEFNRGDENLDWFAARLLNL